MAAISQVNAKNDVTFRLAANKFADWTHEEYKSILGYKKGDQDALNGRL